MMPNSALQDRPGLFVVIVVASSAFICACVLVFANAGGGGDGDEDDPFAVDEKDKEWFRQDYIDRICYGEKFLEEKLKPARTRCNTTSDLVMSEEQRRCFREEIGMTIDYMIADRAFVGTAFPTDADAGSNSSGSSALRVSWRLASADSECSNASADADSPNRAYVECVEQKFVWACKTEFLLLLGFDEGSRPMEGEILKRSGWLRLGPEVLGGALEAAPKGRLKVKFGDREVKVGQRVETSQMVDFPSSLSWEPSNRNLLFTLMFVNAAASPSVPFFFHYLSYNVPGNDVGAGDVAFDWMTPFSFNLNSTSDPAYLVTDDFDFFQPHLVLVYKQMEEISILERQSGCTSDIVDGNRTKTSPSALASKYGLSGPVAAAGFRVGYTAGDTDRMLCMVSRCRGGSPWPAPLPGVNDGSDCRRS